MHITDLELLIDHPANDLPTVATSDDARLFFNFGFEGSRQTSTINGRNLKLPSASLAQLEASKLTDIENKEFCKDLNKDEKCDRNNEVDVISPDCYCTHVVPVEKDKSIELVISAVGPKSKSLNNFRFAHPVHLHGHYFHVVDIQFGEYDSSGRLIAGNSDINCGGQDLCTNPSWKPDKDYSTRTRVTGRVSSTAPLKDTLLIPAGGYAVVYFKTDNPGWWFLHCHIEVHQLEGMGVIINEKGRKRNAPRGMHKCGNFSFTVDDYKYYIKGRNIDCPFIYCGLFVLFLLLFLIAAAIAIVFITFCCILEIKYCRNNCWNKCFGGRCCCVGYKKSCADCCSCYQVDAEEAMKSLTGSDTK